jgi:hypothetical protein
MISLAGLLAAAEFYPARELMAAFLIFSIVFGVVVAAFSVLVAIEELLLGGIKLLQAQLANVLARRHAASSHSRHYPVKESF